MSSRAKSHRSGPAADVLPIAARRHPLVREVDRQLARCGLRIAAPPQDRHAAVSVVIGVSGGPDSLALLLACLALGPRKKRESKALNITVAHVHHHLRDSADDDAAFVQGVCERFGVSCVLKHVQPRKEKGNLAASARKLRYRALAEVAAEVDADCVLVAHHADDQFETMLMAMCRGAGPRGLAGMKPLTKLEGVRVLRPLLRASKSQCEELCRAAEIVWREDPSNRDATRRRARLRRDVIPVLEELWPGAAKRASKNSRLLRTRKSRRGAALSAAAKSR